MLPIKLLGNLLLVNLPTIQMLFMYMFYIIYGGDSATIMDTVTVTAGTFEP
jgi:hypothetical protein